MKPYYEILRDLREDLDLKQNYIASILNTTQQMYSKYESGQTELPLRHLIILCKFYNASADYVLGLKSEKQKLN